MTAIAFAERHEARLIGVDVSIREAYESEERDVALALEEDFTNGVDARGLDFRYHAVAPDALSAEELYHQDVENIVASVLDDIGGALANGDRVELRGFAIFSVRHRPSRSGRNSRSLPRSIVDPCALRRAARYARQQGGAA